VTGYYARRSGSGTPADFRTFVDRMMNNGIGRPDSEWVPAQNFPRDDLGARALRRPRTLRARGNPRRGAHPGIGGTLLSIFRRPRCKNFLLANGLLGDLKETPVDGPDVSASPRIASTVDYFEQGRRVSRPNDETSTAARQNIEARRVPSRNETRSSTAAARFCCFERLGEDPRWAPDVLIAAEYSGGLGSVKWNMGWITTRDVFPEEPV